MIKHKAQGMYNTQKEDNNRRLMKSMVNNLRKSKSREMINKNETI